MRKTTLFCLIILLSLFFAVSVSARPRGLFVGKTFYISGKGDYLFVDEDFPSQVRQCLNNVRDILKENNMDMENVVKNWVYLDDLNNFTAMNEVFKEFFPNNPPARTTIGTGILPGFEKGGCHIEITSIAYSDLSEIKVIGKVPLGLPFSPGILAGDKLYMSGKGDHFPDWSHPATFEEQARQAMKNVGAILADAGLDWRHVVRADIYLDHIGFINQTVMYKVFSEFFEYGNFPALSTIYVDRIPGDCNIEITCIATTDLSERKVVRPPNMRYGPEGSAPMASPGVWAGDTLYLSSQTGFDPVKGLYADDLETQTRLMMQNHLDVLHEAGLEFKDIVSGYVYLRDMKNYADFNKLYNSYFENIDRVRTCIQDNSGYVRDNVTAYTSFIFSPDKRVPQ
ncbi:MAG: RidA family protein [Candidatus Latescibacteria bacterium]|nr:RidA family protein [Candidatus Latescibacterota bacterium]